MRARIIAALVAGAAGAPWPAQSADFVEFDSRGLRGSEGVVVTMRHPAGWKKVRSDDELALAELRGPHGRLTGIVQVARGRHRAGMEDLCHPGRARSMLQNLPADAADTRVTEVVARTMDGRPGFELSYQRSNPPEFVLVRSVIVCLQDSRVLVSCAGSGDSRAALPAIEPVCRQVLDSVRVAEE